MKKASLLLLILLLACFSKLRAQQADLDSIMHASGWDTIKRDMMKFQSTDPRNRVYFESGKYEIRQSQKAYLDEVKQAVAEKRMIIDKIIGYTDTIGNGKYNAWLGMQRARAVAKYIFSGYPDFAEKIISTKGETKPFTSEGTDEEKAFNRCVVIWWKYYLPKAGIKTITLKDRANEKPKREYTINFAKGAQIVYKPGVFPKDVNPDEIEWNEKEVYNPEDMIDEDITTVASDGSCLSSGGMLMLNAKYKGKEVVLLPDSTVEVRIPVAIYNKNMRLYRAKSTLDGVVWEHIDTTLEIDAGYQYYYFRCKNLWVGYNCDMPLPPGPPDMISQRKNILTKLFARRSYTFRSKGYEITRTYLVNKTTNTVLKGYKMKSRLAHFKTCTDIKDYKLVVISNPPGQMNIAVVPVSELRYSRLFNTYTVKRKSYQPIYNRDELRDALSKL